MAASGDSGDAAAAAGAATIHIRCSNGSKLSLEIHLDVTVANFKALLAGRCDVPADQQRLIYKGRILKDEQTLAGYGLESDHTIHLVRSANSSTPSPAAATASPVASGSPNNNSAAFGGSTFPGLGINGLGGSRAGNLFGEMPEFDQVQQQLAQNPTIMREIMNLPAVQSLMNNPELIRSFIMNNPQMSQIIDRNPELAHVLNDPNTLRQTLEAARNPELMREMMRNTDRAMSNIESSPEGFNMLRRMYENVQEPFLNAAAMGGGGETGSDHGSNPFAALLGNQGANQVRDNSLNSTTGSEPTTGSPAPNTNPLPNPWNPTSGGAQPANARSTPASDTRAPGVTGLGGLGLPELERVMGRMPDPSVLSQIMQNPAMNQMMQSLLSDPQYMNQILNVNPDVRGLMESNNQFREMLQNPEFMRQLLSPETLQQMMSLQQSLFAPAGQQQPREQNQAGGGAAGLRNANGLDFLMNMFGGLGAGGFGAPNTSTLPPEELYATQLSQLQEMGFFDTQENIRALTATAGNVNAAIERLLGNPGH